MSDWILLRRAVDDLDSIWDYTVREWGVEQAEAYLHGLRVGFDRVANGEVRGKAISGRHAKLLKYRVKSHFFIYEPGVKQMRIIRILHVQMDPDRHLS